MIKSMDLSSVKLHPGDLNSHRIQNLKDCSNLNFSFSRRKEFPARGLQSSITIKMRKVSRVIEWNRAGEARVKKSWFIVHSYSPWFSFACFATSGESFFFCFSYSASVDPRKVLWKVYRTTMEERNPKNSWSFSEKQNKKFDNKFRPNSTVTRTSKN